MYEFATFYSFQIQDCITNCLQFCLTAKKTKLKECNTINEYQHELKKDIYLLMYFLVLYAFTPEFW